MPSTTQIARFLLLTALFSAPCWFLHAYSHTPGAGAYIRLLMWCPAIAALLTVRSDGPGLASIGWRWPSGRIVAWSCLIPVVYLLVTYVIGSLLGGGTFFNETFLTATRASYAWQRLPAWSIVPCYLVVRGTSGMVAETASALGEEIGWRGFLAPTLAARHGFVTTSLVSGIIWGLWHFPLIFINQPIDSSTWLGAGCFLVGLTGVSFPMTWLRMRSGSVWSAALFHAAHNVVNGMALSLFVPTPRTPLLMDETGLVMAGVGCALAVVWVGVNARAPFCEGSVKTFALV
jgi:uncharacterized protein